MNCNAVLILYKNALHDIQVIRDFKAVTISICQRFFLSEGVYSVLCSVHLVELKGTGDLFAMKAMDKSIMLNRNKVWMPEIFLLHQYVEHIVFPRRN